MAGPGFFCNNTANAADPVGGGGGGGRGVSWLCSLLDVCLEEEDKGRLADNGR